MSEHDSEEDECPCHICNLQRLGFVTEERQWEMSKVLEHLKVTAQMLGVFSHAHLPMVAGEVSQVLVQEMFLGQIDPKQEAWTFEVMQRTMDIKNSQVAVNNLIEVLSAGDEDEKESDLSDEEKKKLMAILKNVDIS